MDNSTEDPKFACNRGKFGRLRGPALRFAVVGSDFANRGRSWYNARNRFHVELRSVPILADVMGSLMSGNSLGAIVGGLVIGALLGVGGTLAVKKDSGGVGGTAADGTCTIDGASAASAELFKVRGESYTAADLPSDVQDVYFQVESQAYRSKRDFIEDVALRIALAKEKDPAVTVASLPPLNQLLELTEPTEAEMTEFFKKNERNLPPGSTYEQIKPQLKQFLSSRSLSSEVSKKVTELEQQGQLSFSFAEPLPPVVELPIANYPTKGNANAAVTVVEVSDYMCPHCRAVKTEVDAVMGEMSEKIRLVQVNFSLRPTGLSGFLARGAYCAGKQGSEAFWTYHDKAHTVPLESAQNVSPDAQKEFVNIAVSVAKDTKIDAKALEECVSSPEAEQHVNTTIQEFSAKGVTGTPTFFVNNRKVMLAGKSLRDVIAAAVSPSSTKN